MFHHLKTGGDSDVEVAVPTVGQVLVGSASGAWIPAALAGTTAFGTPQALTAALTGLTIVGPSVPDYAIQDATNVAPFGFANAEEMRTTLSVIANLQARLAQVETKLKALGIAV